MRKTLSAVALAAAIGFSGMTYANQQTLDAITAAGVQLDPQTAALVVNAQPDQLASVIASIVASLQGNDAAIAAVVSAAVSANPSLASSIVSSAVAAVRGNEAAISAIVTAAVNAAPDQVAAIQSAATAAAPESASVIQTASTASLESDGITATGGTGEVNTNSLPFPSSSGGGENASPS